MDVETQQEPPRPGRPKNDAILVADNVVRTFGGLRAVDVEHFEIERGKITALIGPNGAGKTTFFNLLTGFDRPDTGEWAFNGKSLHGVPPYKVARLGMVRTFQLTKVLSRLTVIENMRLGATGQRGEKIIPSLFKALWSDQEASNTTRAEELLGRFTLDTKRDDFAGSLSGGQRKLLEMCPRPDGRPRADHARRAHGRREPGTQAVAARPREVAARRGPHRAVRRARHGHGPRHLRLGRRHGRRARSSPRARRTA